MEKIKVQVKKWEPGITYPCPKCGNNVSLNEDGKWICKPCDVRLLIRNLK